MVNLINKINKKVNTLAGVSNRIDSSKVDLNDKINDVPSAMQVADQKKLEPEPAKSTIGLIGFKEDIGSLEDKILKSQNLSENEVIQRALQEQFGTVQVDHEGDGGTQTKQIEVPAEMAQTFDQRKTIAMSTDAKQRFALLMDKIKGGNTVAIQKATHDEVVNPQGRSLKKQIKSTSKTRLTIDGLNMMINEFTGNLLSKKKSAKANKVNQTPEVKNPQPTSLDLDNPLVGNFQ